MLYCYTRGILFIREILLLNFYLVFSIGNVIYSILLITFLDLCII